MTRSSPPIDEATDAQIAAICEEISDRLRAGQPVEDEDYAARWPQHAEELRNLVPAMRALAALPARETSADDLAGGLALREALGDFHIERPLGRGGMGIVYEARQLSLGRKVALKVLPLAAVMDERKLVRFKNEALAAASLNHPHIVPVYAVGEVRGVHYYAMQLIRGQNLAEIIAELRIREGIEPEGTVKAEPAPDSLASQLSRVQSPDVAAHQRETDDRQAALTKLSSTNRTEIAIYCRNVARMIRDAAEALGSAHAEGVIHRDVKPSNLMLDAGSKLWVTDFGLAQMRGGNNLTMTGDLVGTLRYMSPEQVAGKHSPIDHRTDIYSLGATLYESLTLRPMHASEKQADLLHQLAHVEPASVRRLRNAIPADLETIVVKMTAKSATDRYPTMRDVADDLERFIDDRPIKAKPIGVVERTRRLVRRHSFTLAGTLVVALAVSVALGVAFGMTYLARNEAVAKEKEAEEKGKELEKRNEQNQRLAAEKSREAEKALAFAALVVDVFKSADPLGLEGSGFRDSSEAVKQMTAVELLTRVAARTQSSQSITGAARAKVLDGLGDAFRSLGQAETAHKLLNEARSAQEQATDAIREEDKALVQFHLGMVHHDRREFDLAEAYYKRTIDLVTTDSRSSADFKAQVQFRYAYLLGEAQRTKLAVSLFEKVRDDRLLRLGPAHPDTQAAELGIILVELPRAPASKILQRLGNLPATQSIMAEAIKGYVFARLHRQAGRHSEAKQAYEELLATFRSKLPPGHPLLGLCLGDMAGYYKSIGEMDRAMTLAEEAAGIARRTIPTHPLSIELLSALAQEYSAAGEHRKAIALYEEVDVYLGRLNSPPEEGVRKTVRQRLEASRSQVDSGESDSN